MADEEVQFEAIEENYELPDDFDAGVGEVRSENEALPNYYSSLAAMVNKIRRQKAELKQVYRRWKYLEVQRDVVGLKGLRKNALACIEKIENLDGVPFEMPQQLENAVKDLCGSPSESEEEEEESDGDEEEGDGDEEDSEEEDSDEEEDNEEKGNGDEDDGEEEGDGDEEDSEEDDEEDEGEDEEEDDENADAEEGSDDDDDDEDEDEDNSEEEEY